MVDRLGVRRRAGDRKEREAALDALQLIAHRAQLADDVGEQRGEIRERSEGRVHRGRCSDGARERHEVPTAVMLACMRPPVVYYPALVGGLRTVLVFMLIGALLGALVASFVVPPWLAWYNEPGAITPGKQVETLCNLPELIRYTSSRLLRGQLIGAAIGALVFLFPGILVVRRRADTTGLPVKATT